MASLLQKPVALLLFTSLLATPLHGQQTAPTKKNSTTNAAAGSKPGSFNYVDEPSIFQPRYNPSKARGFIWAPLVSIVAPGFDQWWERQLPYAGVYTGGAIAATLYGSYNLNKAKEFQDSPEYDLLSDEEKENRLMHGEYERRGQYGFQIAFGLGSLSAYHSFRTAVTTHRQYGGFGFLGKAETPGELLAAPFQFHFLKRPTTYIPLAIIATLYAITLNTIDESEDYEKDSLSRSDIFFAGGTSYNAGVHEELLFRGWLMPSLMEYWGSPFWSNTATTAIFALAHLGSVDVPIAQAALGWHLGWVTQRNHWTLSESIFIHAWWDVFALLAAYQVKKKVPDAKLPAIWLPPLEFSF